jgi:hypothetical protein
MLKRNIFSKWNTLALAWVLTVGLVSCSSDDSTSDDNNPSQQPGQTEVEIVDEEEESFTNAASNDFSGLLGGLVVGQMDGVLKEMRDNALANGQELVDTNNDGNNNLSKLTDFSIASITLKYYSVDGQGNRIQLSGRVYLPKLKDKYVDCSDILLNCHPTATGNEMISMGSLRTLTADSLVVVEPHYQGFGASADKKQTYLCQKLIARQCVDMIPAVIRLLEKRGVNLLPGYGTYVTGYSQGGGNAVAVGRHIEKEASSDLRKQINLKKVTAGAGPYDPMGTFSYWLKEDRVTLSMVLPMVIQGMMEGHPDVMKGIKFADYFSDLYKSTGFIEQVENNNLSAGMMIDSDPRLQPINLGPSGLIGTWMRFSGIMSDEVQDPNSHMRKALEECLTYEDVTDWIPSVPLELYSCDGDNVVPYEPNTLAYYNKLKKANARVKLVDNTELADHILGQVNYAYRVTCEKAYCN